MANTNDGEFTIDANLGGGDDPKPNKTNDGTITNPGESTGEGSGASTSGAPEGMSEEDLKAFREWQKAQAEAGKKEGDEGEEGDEGDDGDDGEGDDPEVQLDKDGNLVDKDGKVLHKKGTFMLDEEGNATLLEDGPVMSELVEKATEAGYEFTDEDGNPIEFGNDTQGYLDFTAHVAKQELDATINNLFTTYPILGEVYRHLAAGLPAQDILKDPAHTRDFTKIDIPKDNAAGRKAVIRDYLTLVGNNDEETATDMLSLLEKGGRIDAYYEKAKTGLVNWQEKKKAEAAEAAKVEEKKREQRARQFVESVESTVNTGKIGDFSIAPKDRKAFIDYVTRPTESGSPKSVEDYSKLPLEKQLVLDFLLFKGLDLSEFIDMKANSKQAENIRKRKGKVIKVAGNRETANTTGNYRNISLQNIQ